MNLLFIYGPPASGKLTIAEELVKLNGYKLFHNHLTQDLAKELYPEFDEIRFGLVDKIRLDVFEYAAQKSTDIVFTFVYSGDIEDDHFISKTIEVVAKNRGNIYFVQLEAPDEVLLERVNEVSRKRFHKLANAGILNDQLKNGDYRASVRHPNVYKLDSSKQRAADSAKLILKHISNLEL